MQWTSTKLLTIWFLQMFRNWLYSLWCSDWLIVGCFCLFPTCITRWKCDEFLCLYLIYAWVYILKYSTVYTIFSKCVLLFLLVYFRLNSCVCYACLFLVSCFWVIFMLILCMLIFGKLLLTIFKHMLIFWCFWYYVITCGDFWWCHI